MTTATTTVVGAPDPADRGDAPRPLAKGGDPADRIFRGSARGAGAVVLLIMTLVGVFLGGRALEALGDAGPAFLTTSAWEPDSHRFGIAAVLPGTVLIGACGRRSATGCASRAAPSRAASSACASPAPSRSAPGSC
ncbi:hypothetical protein AB0D29_07905 [Streptomyces sp. NPDC048424]|uniref:hypothetical protein n=1 Tax=Streptomyces sp. NPDC048424 TaxID=3155265 RepID=UPI00341B9E30